MPGVQRHDSLAGQLGVHLFLAFWRESLVFQAFDVDPGHPSEILLGGLHRVNVRQSGLWHQHRLGPGEIIVGAVVKKQVADDIFTVTHATQVIR